MPNQPAAAGPADSVIPQTVKPQHPNSSQNALKFRGAREDMVIMGDGPFRAGGAAQLINFELMSARERQGNEIS